MFNTNIENNITVLDKLTRANENFDIIKRVIRINKRKSVLYFIDGLLKEAIMEKMMEFFYGITGIQRNWQRTFVTHFLL